ncbi:MAG TPA: alkaline phosphatase family protein [Anaerolineae bacterium]
MKTFTLLVAASLVLAGCAPASPIPPGPTRVPATATSTAPVPVTPGGTTPAPATATSTASVPVTPGGTTPAPSGSAPIQHVFVILMENRGYDQVLNTVSSPYITSLATSNAFATNYHALTHPSLPNYLQLVGGDNFGITTDCTPSDTCHVNAASLADLLEARGLTWRAYMEAMPTPCDMSGTDKYAPKHNPFLYFDDIRNNSARCAAHEVPYSAFATDLARAATTPNYAFISPDLCNDMHDCRVATGDAWLSNNVQPILQSPACITDNCLVVVTWDEDDSHGDNHVLTIFAGSGARTGGATSAVSYTHYSLLRTIEEIFGLPTLTNNDASATTMTDMLK